MIPALVHLLLLVIYPWLFISISIQLPGHHHLKLSCFVARIAISGWYRKCCTHIYYYQRFIIGSSPTSSVAQLLAHLKAIAIAGVHSLKPSAIWPHLISCAYTWPLKSPVDLFCLLSSWDNSLFGTFGIHRLSLWMVVPLAIPLVLPLVMLSHSRVSLDCYRLLLHQSLQMTPQKMPTPQPEGDRLVSSVCWSIIILHFYFSNSSIVCCLLQIHGVTCGSQCLMCAKKDHHQEWLPS